MLLLELLPACRERRKLGMATTGPTPSRAASRSPALTAGRAGAGAQQAPQPPLLPQPHVAVRSLQPPPVPVPGAAQRGMD